MADDTTADRAARIAPAPHNLARKPGALKSRALPAWARVFISELAATSNVSASALKADVTTYKVYDLRRRHAEFNRMWQVALCEGYDNLELDLLARLRSGELPGADGARRGGSSFDNATALRLLTAHRESVAKERANRDNEDADEILASIDAKLDLMRERSLAAAARAQDGV